MTTAPSKFQSLHLIFILIVFISLASLLPLRRRLIPPLHASDLHPVLVSNHTLLLALASTPLPEADFRHNVDQLLDASGDDIVNFHSSRYHRYHSRLAYFHLRGGGPGHRHRMRAPMTFRNYPEFRRSLRDWLRRRRYQPSIMSDLIKHIKFPIDRHYHELSPESSRYSSCAVVGNSGVLLKSDRGELIDSHHVVIRLNNARTEGYQKNVGTKTTISFMNSNILHVCARREGCFCHPYSVDVPIVMYICQPSHFLDYTICNSSHKSPLLITDPRFDILCGRIVKYYSLKRFVEETGKSPENWGKLHDEKAFHYSSGMQAVMLAVGICDKVSVFGFGKFADAKHHYHTNQKAELDLHDYKAEYDLYKDLMQRPQVIPFLNESGIKMPPVVFYY